MRWIFHIRPLTLLHISNSRSVGQCLASQKVLQKPCYRNVGFKSIVSGRYVHNIDFEEAVTVKSDSDELLFLRAGRDLLPGSHVDHVRNSLYKVSSDPVVNKLRKCRNYDELINTFNGNSEVPTPVHIIQTILSLFDIEHRPADSGVLADKLHSALASIKDQLSLEELSYGLFYLSKLLTDPHSLTPLVQYSLERTRDADHVDLPTLSRLTVILNILREIPYFYTYPVIVPRMEGHLNRVDLPEDDLIYITVAMKHFTRYLSPDLMHLYRTRVEQLERSGSFTPQRTPLTNMKIIKICNLLNSSPWSMENSQLVRKLMQNVNASALELQDLSVAFKITQSQLEPRLLINSILNRAIELRKESDSVHPLLLQCEVIQTLPEARRNLVDSLEAYLMDKKELLSTEDVLLCFKMLRQAKVSQSRLCNLYWKKVLEKIKAEPLEQESDRLVHHCHRYMYFNNNLGGTYRYFAFERFALDLIATELREGMSQFVPAKLARLSSFLIGYGTSERIPQTILDKLINCRGQLSYTDCLQLSRGIQIALELRFKNGLPHSFARQILQLENAIDGVIVQKLNNNKKQNHNISSLKLSITDANVILRGLTMRKSNKAAEVFQRVVQWYERGDFEAFQITSRIIRDTTMNLSLSRIKAPKLLESFLEYLVEQKGSITGDTAEKILHSCYALGHETNNYEALRIGAEIVERDFQLMTGLAIVNSCLALCYYGGLSQELMTKVFCIEFIKRLEDEIKMCYSKATYPQKVLNKVMQLNRSVCLDYPEYSVPWFQQNYVEAQTTKSSPNENFQQAVLHRLRQIFPADQMDKIELNHSTAYGYRLDFLLKLDKKGTFLPKDSETHARRLALILFNPNSYCSNAPTSLCGYEQLRQRHLEILGFEVMEINYRDWSSSAFNLDTLRQQFIQRNVLHCR